MENKKTEATPSEPEPNSRTSEQLGIASNNNVPQDIETVNSQNQADYRNLQNIFDIHYNRIEENTIGAKQSTKLFWYRNRNRNNKLSRNRKSRFF